MITTYSTTVLYDKTRESVAILIVYIHSLLAVAGIGNLHGMTVKLKPVHTLYFKENIVPK